MVYLELTIIVVGALCQGKERNDACALPLEDFASLILELLECLSVVGVCHHEQ
ncbi:MAG: hypothetical protein K9G11_00720 [Rickettsiaceae bacterium]|nr:hypothetical protein [Rickettsiaceae bacterium]